MRKSILKWVLGIMMISMSAVSMAAVNINKAPATTIAKELKGIGKARANAIVKERKAHGPFKNGDDLTKRVKGVGKATIAKNKDKILYK